MIRPNRLVCGLALALFCATNAWAQDEDVENEQAPPVRMGAIFMGGSGEGGVVEFQTVQPLEMSPILLSADSGMASIAFSPMMGGSGIGSNSLGWLNDDSILDELEIVSEQREALQKLQEDIRQQRRDFFGAYQEVAPEKRIDFMREFSTLLTNNTDEQVRDILLPHQRKRFEQIQLQTKLRRRGLNAAHNEELAKLLGITPEQREEMREKQVEVQKELQKKIELLRKEAVGEILSVLTPAQQKKLETLTGEEFEFKTRTMVPPPLPHAKDSDEKDKR